MLVAVRTAPLGVPSDEDKGNIAAEIVCAVAAAKEDTSANS